MISQQYLDVINPQVVSFFFRKIENLEIFILSFPVIFKMCIKKDVHGIVLVVHIIVHYMVTNWLL